LIVHEEIFSRCQDDRGAPIQHIEPASRQKARGRSCTHVQACITKSTETVRPGIQFLYTVLANLSVRWRTRITPTRPSLDRGKPDGPRLYFRSRHNNPTTLRRTIHSSHPPSYFRY
jgi:hypothetical protein